jgi:hypothetical protein
MSLRPRLRWLLILLVTLGTLRAATWNAPLQLRAADPPPEVVRPAGWQYPTESAWIAGEVLNGIAALGDAAHGRPSGPPVRVALSPSASMSKVVFEVSREGADAKPMEFATHIFDPATYAPWAAAWLGPGEAGSDAAERRVHARLTAPTVETLHAVSTEVSEALTRAPRSVSAHEDAALVLSALAFREAAAGHTDARHEMARIAAHLAVARALRGAEGSSVSGRLGHLTLLLLAGRTADVVARLEALPPTDDVDEQAWRRALRMRATGDWRAFTLADARTLLERLAWYRAWNTHVGGDRSHLQLQQLSERERALPDWGRMTLVGSVSVRDCHEFATGGLAHDWPEVVRAAELFGRSVSDAATLAEALNEPPLPGGVRRAAGQTRIEVLDWGRVAAFLQRHVAARGSYEIACWDRTLGLPERATDALRGQERMVGALTLFPFEAQRWVKTAVEHQAYSKAAGRVVDQHPERVVLHAWRLLFDVPAFSSAPPTVPPSTLWFDRPYPLGTGPLLRGYLAPDLGGAVVDELVAIDPYETGLRRTSVQQRLGKEPAYEALRDGYGPALEWNAYAMEQVSARAPEKSDERHRWLAKSCGVNADRCHLLARFLEERGDEPAAAETYRRWWREAMDRVAVSNQIRWLVEYDERHGRPEEALEIARDAAGTYSWSGLDTLAWLQEERGRTAEAETLYQQMVERYDTPEALYDFYARLIEAGQTRYEARQKQLLADTFPGGMEKVGSSLPGAPPDGVMFVNPMPAAVAAGFHHRDVVVALDGIRIHNKGQWHLVRRQEKTGPLRVLVYRNGAYQEVTATFEGRRIPTGLERFPKGR